MIASLAVIVLAFAWLMYETKFLTIRLPYGKPFAPSSIADLLPVIFTAMIIFYILKRLGKDLGANTSANPDSLDAPRN